MNAVQAPPQPAPDYAAFRKWLCDELRDAGCELRTLSPEGMAEVTTRRMAEQGWKLEAPPQVRALLADQADATPAVRPRVFNAGDPEPADVRQVHDRDGDVWSRGDRGIWNTPGTKGFPWEHVARRWSPLTEVLPGGGDR